MDDQMVGSPPSVLVSYDYLSGPLQLSVTGFPVWIEPSVRSTTVSAFQRGLGLPGFGAQLQHGPKEQMHDNTELGLEWHWAFFRLVKMNGINLLAHDAVQ
jgi:hypothetical protein